MQLIVWTSSARHKTLDALSPAMARGVSDIELVVVEKPPEFWQGLKPKTVFALGKEPLEWIASKSLVQKNRTITSLRGQPMNFYGASLLLSYSPGVADNDYGHYIDLLTDFGLALRLHRTGSMEPKLGEYRYVSNFDDIVAKIEAQFAATGKPVELALDTETVGLDEFKEPSLDHPGAYIVTIQITVEKGKTDVVRFSSRQEEEDRLSDIEFAGQLAWILSTPKVSTRGANLKYDLRWLYRRAGIECTNFKFDTTLVGSLLDENRSNGLDVHAKIYVPSLGGYSDAFDRQVDKSRMDLVPPEKLLPYAGGDTDAALQVAEAEKAELLRDKSLTSFYVNILHPAARAFEKVERGGILVDTEVMSELEADLNNEAVRLVHEAKSILGGRIVAKHADDTKPGGMNLTKASMLADFMFSPMGLNLKPLQTTAKTGAPSTSLDHLMMFKDVPEAKAFVSLLSDYSSVTKTLNTYVIGFLKHLRSDGRFHPSFWFFAGNKDEGEGGTNTGRLSCKDPAWQCLAGDSLVSTSDGLKRIDWLVENRGAGLKVLTHTGKWRDIVGTYMNGVQPTFKLEFSNGYRVQATGNHPVLTERGWVRTDELKEGDVAYADQGFRDAASHPGVHQPGVQLLGGNEEQVSVPNQQGLGAVRGEGYKSSPGVAEVRDLSSRHGSEAGGHNVGTNRRERGLLCNQLQVGDPEGAAKQPQEYQADRTQRKDAERGRVGSGGGNQQGKATLQAGEWDAYGAGVDEHEAPSGYFQKVTLVSISCAGDVPTYDLTIQGSHSFVANGIVVHNTVPKHTKWAKRLRKAYIAPPGHLVMERDYSQGELKVVACIANERNMIQAYKEGRDLHAVTSGRFSGYSYEEMMALKKTNKELYDSIRQLGKAGNFGLLYGMGAEGFLEYAILNYGVKDLTLEKAAAFREGFFETYPGLPKYHDAYKDMARKFQMVRSPLGRVRHLPLVNSANRMERAKAERQAINSPVQSTLSDMLIWSVSLEDREGLSQIAPCFGAVHDAAYNYVPEDQVDMIVPRTLEIMENLPFELVGWNPELQFTADAKLGPNMAELVEYA